MCLLYILKDKKKVKQGCEESERRERVQKVAAILKEIPYETERLREDAILSFSKANLTIEEIDGLVNPLRPSYKTDFNKRIGVY